MSSLRLFSISRRYLSKTTVSGGLKPQFNVTVIGAAGGIGQPLSLLLKQSPLVKTLNLYDVANTSGVAADVSHIDTQVEVHGYLGEGQLSQAVKNAHLIIIPAGVPRKPGMTRDDLFNINAGIIQNIARQTAQICPKAMMCVISNPVNSLVPIVAETYKEYNVYDSKRLFGVTTLDVCRANTFVGQILKKDPAKLSVKVIGGHAGTTILPLLSQIKGLDLSSQQLKDLMYRIQFGGDEVVKAKAGKGSATLSMAYAGAKFATNLLAAMNGKPNIVQCTYVENTLTDASFFATSCLLGPDGVHEIKSFGKLSELEQANMDEMLPTLIQQINKGKEFSSKNKK